MGQHVPRREEGLGTECVLGVPVATMEGRSFQETLVRLPIRLRGFGLRSFADTANTAFIGGVELALGREEMVMQVMALSVTGVCLYGWGGDCTMYMLLV